MKKQLLLSLFLCLTALLRAQQEMVPVKDSDLSSYLMVYFKDDTHGLHMALSEDGSVFTDVNDGKPILEGDTIATQKGIRDPHISRGPDGAFYVSMTDLHIFGKQKGFRNTQWERPEDQYAWGNNRGFVMMKSYDLIHWTRSNVLLDSLYPGLDVGCAWAPQSIYDAKAKKMMLYFTMRIGNGKTGLYYAYTDDAFTTLITKPKVLFEYPKKDVSILDADITALPDGRFCMMYVAQDGRSGIKMATSKRINKGYSYEDHWVDFESKATEAPNVWKRNGSNTWVLMYDVYGIRPHNFGFAETTDFKTFKNLGHFNEGSMKTTNFSIPKHGAVVSLTKKEAERLKKKWAARPVEEAFDGYLFAYFEGRDGDRRNQEQLRFAVSKDGVSWKALNKNKPILGSDTISKSGGIRDPHLLRGVKGDGYFIVATDMSTASNGWGPNPGLVLLKSKDLLEWEHGYLELEQLYPEKFTNVQWIWAPQTIYDPAVQKYLVYFTIKYKDNEALDFYSAYANEAFDGFENEPVLMFQAQYGAIDGDIIFKDGQYHFFFKGNTKDANGKEIKSGIKKATSTHLQGPWTETFEYVDAYSNSRTNVEGSSVFKLNHSDEYLLMYDLYSSGRYEFQRSKDLIHFSEKPESFTKNFHPRHGSVISINAEEALRLNNKWGGVPREMLPANCIYRFESSENPIFQHKFTADPAALVSGDTMWIYTGEDLTANQKNYRMKNWCAFSSTDLKHWTEYPIPLKASDFKWDRVGSAYAGHVVPRNGKYYWYVSTNRFGIGVAVSEKPEGPYSDVLGKPLLTNSDCFDSSHSWACIDPATFIDDDGQAWIFWGNRECYYAKLKENMIEIDGAIKRMMFKGFEFTEAPWIHKHNNRYYLTYATGFPEKIAYAVSDKVDGPYEYKGILNEIAGNSNTNHQSIVQFKGDWYFVYHTGGMQNGGGSYSRSVCMDRLKHNEDGTIERIVMTTEGIH